MCNFRQANLCADQLPFQPLDSASTSSSCATSCSISRRRHARSCWPTSIACSPPTACSFWAPANNPPTLSIWTRTLAGGTCYFRPRQPRPLRQLPSGHRGVVPRGLRRAHAPQRQGWPAIARGESTLILAPTGTGKTLTAFLWCLDRLMLQPRSRRRKRLPHRLHLAAQGAGRRCRAQPALAARRHRQYGPAHGRAVPRAGDQRPHRRHPQKGARPLRRHPAEILITTPESLYLLLTSQAGEACARWTRSSSTRFTRWCPPSAARIWRSRWNAWKR
jgi:ATP-dependent helicase YprA (DUF1998 family)